LNEGFATYSEALFVEHLYGREVYNNYIAQEMDRAKNAIGSIWVNNINPKDPFITSWIFDSYRTYSKGSVILHMLRGVVGDENFFNILKTYSNDPELAYGVAETEDFHRICELVSGMNLDGFFDAWIYGENFPEYSYGYTMDKSSDGYDINLVIDQVQRTNLFWMPIEIVVQNGSKKYNFTVWDSLKTQNFTLKIPDVEGPIMLLFDPNNLILKEAEFKIISGNDENSDNELLPEFSLSQNYPNPFNPTTTIKYSIPAGSADFNSVLQNVIIKVYDVMGREVTTIVEKNQKPGNYQVTFDASNLTSGVYYYQLKVADFVQTNKMLLLK
ncbi:MAG: M1 family aminopeptidase, partial [Melioribacteraceae bacterium]|nr:M1 family aminopeptidase [Melioribacteraceae bacterium]